MKGKSKIVMRIEGSHKMMQAHLLPDRYCCTSCISLSLFGAAICRKRSVKNNFHFPQDNWPGLDLMSAHTVVFVPLRSAQQGNALLEAAIFCVCSF